MRIGFTGTQQGMTEAQKQQLRVRLADIVDCEKLAYLRFHHGDCIGADAQAHLIAAQTGFWIVIHPPENASRRAYRNGDQYLLPKPYLDRNHDIVDATDFLIACPSGAEVLRSGTWATVRYARKKGKRVEIIMPDGSLV